MKTKPALLLLIFLALTLAPAGAAVRYVNQAGPSPELPTLQPLLQGKWPTWPRGEALDVKVVGNYAFLEGTAMNDFHRAQFTEDSAREPDFAIAAVADAPKQFMIGDGGRRLRVES